jgi:D-alanyl-D-alanine carboxypeptidase/D-alanyl-D-alanine-endopeptidase (penicillin-binding protein 4)
VTVSKRSATSGSFLLRTLLVLAVVLVLSVGVVTWVVRSGDDGGPTPNAGPTGTLPPPSGPGLSLRPPPAAPAVLAAASDARPVSLARLKRQLAPALAAPGLGNHLTLGVSQLGRPKVHWSYGAPIVMPASTLKLVTTAAALSVLGPEHRFTTAVVRGSDRQTLVLVGGGDPLLTATTPTVQEAAGTYPETASLEELATATAARLATDGVRRVRVAYDASLFSGPAVNPHWPSTYVPDNVVSPISALWVDEGRQSPGFAQRSADPAQAAAEAFRSELTKAGVKVVGQVTQQRRPPTPRPPVAEVSSAPLEEIVQHILEQSDNEGSEVLLRQVALARGQVGSSAAGAAAVRSTLAGLGLDVRGLRLYDGSGLSRDDVLPAALLLDVLETAAAPAHPELRAVVTGLPVAGFSGTLGYRFEGEAEDGRGYVLAKTGTLTEAGVHSLAGIAMTRTGQALFFVAVADRVAVPQALEARAGLDRIAAALSTCGC